MFVRKRKTIMLVDDNQVDLITVRNMLKGFYEIYAIPSAERLFKFMENIEPDLILLDVEMPDMNGFDIMRILRAHSKYSDTPVIFVTSKTEELKELEGLALGAVDYVTKPFSSAILLKRIENHLLIKEQKAELKKLNNNLVEMVKKKASQVYELQNSIISSIAEIVEFRDDCTGGHINRTQEYMQLLVNYLIDNDMYLDEVMLWDNIDYIVPSTQLHDLGKIFISDSILNKPDKLTPAEFNIMKTHVTKGVEVIRRMGSRGLEKNFFDCAEIAALTHHEKWDGSGYPNGLKGRETPLLGRLMAIVDVYDALTSIRPYKNPFPPERASEIIRENSGTHFDPALVKVFKEVENNFSDMANGRGPLWEFDKEDD